MLRCPSLLIPNPQEDEGIAPGDPAGSSVTKNEISALQFQIARQMYHISSMSISQGVQEKKGQLRQKTSTFVKGSFFGDPKKRLLVQRAPWLY